MELQEIRTVTLCGHSKLTNPDVVRVWLAETVESLIAQGAVTFYLGGYGAFDRMAASVPREKKRLHSHIESVLVLPYLERDMDASGYDTTVYPPLESVPRRFAISKRNWMVCDILSRFCPEAHALFPNARRDRALRILSDDLRRHCAACC